MNFPGRCGRRRPPRPSRRGGKRRRNRRRRSRCRHISRRSAPRVPTDNAPIRLRHPCARAAGRTLIRTQSGRAGRRSGPAPRARASRNRCPGYPRRALRPEVGTTTRGPFRGRAAPQVPRPVRPVVPRSAFAAACRRAIRSCHLDSLGASANRVSKYTNLGTKRKQTTLAAPVRNTKAPSEKQVRAPAQPTQPERRRSLSSGEQQADGRGGVEERPISSRIQRCRRRDIAGARPAACSWSSSIGRAWLWPPLRRCATGPLRGSVPAP